MNKRKILITALVVIVLGALIYLQIKTWRKFDWKSFKEQTEDVNIGLIALGVGIIYFDYYLRALRWKILLRPVCDVKTSSLMAPTMIGFTAMALLGRAGEFVRPFLIGRKANLTMSSQLGVWVVERLFDVGAFAVIMAVNVLLAPDLKYLPGFASGTTRSEEHTSELQSLRHLVCRLLLEKKKKKQYSTNSSQNNTNKTN